MLKHNTSTLGELELGIEPPTSL